MSPRRRVKHAQVKQRRPADYAYAALAAAAVVGVTALCIWLIRPGGYASDQPRIATVLFGAFCAFAFTFWVSRGPDRPVIGRGTIWGGLILSAVVLGSAGYLIRETTKWKHALIVFGLIAGGIILLGVLAESALLIRRFSNENVGLRLLLSAAVALLCGAAGALAWPGGIKIETPSTIVPVTTTPITPPSSAPLTSPPESRP